MSHATVGPSVERLALELTAQDQPDATTAELTRWLAGSSRFRAFAEANRAKIRKKLRTATDAETRRDVRVELAAAHRLLADRRIDLAFEAYGAGRVGPDFTITFRDSVTFNLEVTRLRHLPDASTGGPLLAKLRQLPPSVPNALLIAIDADSAEALDVAGMANAVRDRADAKDDAFFTRRGFDGAKGFYDRFLRLGAVVVWCEGAVGDGRASVWTNRSARIPIPMPAARACLACLRAEA